MKIVKKIPGILYSIFNWIFQLYTLRATLEESSSERFVRWKSAKKRRKYSAEVEQSIRCRWYRKLSSSTATSGSFSAKGNARITNALANHRPRSNFRESNKIFARFPALLLRYLFRNKMVQGIVHLFQSEISKSFSNLLESLFFFKIIEKLNANSIN